MLEILSWWSFIYGEKGVFREDGNEIMESQQSICYPESQKTPTKNPTKLKRKKEFSKLSTRREKATPNTEQGNICSLTSITFSKTGLGVSPHQVCVTAQRYQCLHEVATNLHWQPALVKNSKQYSAKCCGQGWTCRTEQNLTLSSHRVTKPAALSSLLNSQLLSLAKLHQWGIKALFALPRQDIPSSALRTAYGRPGYSDFSASTHMLKHDLGKNNLIYIFQ